MRRIEAATGWNSLEVLHKLRQEMADISALVKARPGELVKKVEGLQQELRNTRKDMQRVAAQAASPSPAG